jgi:hypothetical protein
MVLMKMRRGERPTFNIGKEDQEDILYAAEIKDANYAKAKIFN